MAATHLAIILNNVVLPRPFLPTKAYLLPKARDMVAFWIRTLQGHQNLSLTETHTASEQQKLLSINNNITMYYKKQMEQWRAVTITTEQWQLLIILSYDNTFNITNTILFSAPCIGGRDDHELNMWSDWEWMTQHTHPPTHFMNSKFTWLQMLVHTW